MAIEHLNQAFKADIAKSSSKFVLVALADYANEVGEAYPSVETICRKTALNRKTVMRCLQDLVDIKAIADTGRRHGKTSSIPVWKLTIQNIQAVPKSGPLSSPKNGTVSEGEAVPILDPSSTKNGTAKQSQNWDIEPSVSLTPRSEPSDTTSRARNSQPIPEKPPTDFPTMGNATNGKCACEELLDYLNQKTGSAYRPVPANTKLINARLEEGHSPQDVVDVINMKSEEWQGGKFEKYLRPATLFNAEKFNQYVGRLPEWRREMAGDFDWTESDSGTGTGNVFEGEYVHG